jgi:hypothetical protein
LHCQGGNCVCSASSCPGCCSANGTSCQTGDRKMACGTGGASCVACVGGDKCTNHICQ